MSEMSIKESIEWFEEGLKKAASRARELGRMQKVKHWDVIAKELDTFRTNGVYMANSYSRAWSAILNDVEHYRAQMGAKADAEQEAREALQTQEALH